MGDLRPDIFLNNFRQNSCEIFDAISNQICRAPHLCVSFCNVSDKPEVSLSLGRNIEMNKIKEGEDIYLECLVNSRPQPTRLYFTHQAGTNKLKMPLVAKIE